MALWGVEAGLGSSVGVLFPGTNFEPVLPGGWEQQVTAWDTWAVPFGLTWEQLDVTIWDAWALAWGS